MYKYLLFLIIGIILFVLLNSVDSFNVGGQFKVELYEEASVVPAPNSPDDPVMTPPPGIDVVAPPIGGAGGGSRPQTLVEIFTDIFNMVDVCTSPGLRCCADIHQVEGGSCQIYTIAALFRVLGINIDETDVDYLNSFGRYLAKPDNLHDALQCLINTTGAVDDETHNLNPNMLSILRSNGIKPKIQTAFVNIAELLFDRIYVGGFNINQPTGTHYKMYEYAPAWESPKVSISIGHAMLLYKTNYLGFKSFVEELDITIPDDDLRLQQLHEKLVTLDSLHAINANDPRLQENAIVCICIDHRNGLFYALTEADNPPTIPPPLYIQRAGVDADTAAADFMAARVNVVQYDEDWRNKVVFGFCSGIFRNIVNTESGESIELVAPEFKRPSILRYGNISERFIQSEHYEYLKSKTIFMGLSFNEDISDELGIGDTYSRNEVCYGKINRRCRSNMSCNSQYLSCADNTEFVQYIPNINTRGPICLPSNTEGVRCDMDNDTPCNSSKSLYCREFDERKYCVKAVGLGEACRENIIPVAEVPSSGFGASSATGGASSGEVIPVAEARIISSPIDPNHVQFCRPPYVCREGICNMDPLCAANTDMGGGSMDPIVLPESNVLFHPSLLELESSWHLDGQPDLGDWCLDSYAYQCIRGLCTGSKLDDELDNGILYYVCEEM